MPETSAPRRLPLAVTGLCLVQFMDVLGVTVVITALPPGPAASSSPPQGRPASPRRGRPSREILR
jgi:hypothetical protein